MQVFPSKSCMRLDEYRWKDDPNDAGAQIKESRVLFDTTKFKDEEEVFTDEAERPSAYRFTSEDTIVRSVRLREVPADSDEEFATELERARGNQPLPSFQVKSLMFQHYMNFAGAVVVSPDGGTVRTFPACSTLAHPTRSSTRPCPIISISSKFFEAIRDFRTKASSASRQILQVRSPPSFRSTIRSAHLPSFWCMPNCRHSRTIPNRLIGWPLIQTYENSFSATRPPEFVMSYSAAVWIHPAPTPVSVVDSHWKSNQNRGRYVFA